ncbi:hypothetical protein ES703_121100 [subsurface metagenome]
MASLGSGWFKASAASIILTFDANCSSPIPVPLPVILATRSPVMTAHMAALGVVLPIPMSPTPTMSSPLATSSFITSMPASIARSASSRLIAAPLAILPVPEAIFLETSKGWGSRFADIPMSTTTTRALMCRASTLMAAPPFKKLSTIWAVTSWG